MPTSALGELAGFIYLTDIRQHLLCSGHCSRGSVRPQSSCPGGSDSVVGEKRPHNHTHQPINRAVLGKGPEQHKQGTPTRGEEQERGGVGEGEPICGEDGSVKTLKDRRESATRRWHHSQSGQRAQLVSQRQGDSWLHEGALNRPACKGRPRWEIKLGGRTGPRKEVIEENVVWRIFLKSLSGYQEIDYGDARLSSAEEVVVILQGGRGGGSG